MPPSNTVSSIPGVATQVLRRKTSVYIQTNKYKEVECFKNTIVSVVLQAWKGYGETMKFFKKTKWLSNLLSRKQEVTEDLWKSCLFIVLETKTILQTFKVNPWFGNDEQWMKTFFSQSKMMREREDYKVIQKDLGSRNDFLIVSTWVFVFFFHCSRWRIPVHIFRQIKGIK